MASVIKHALQDGWQPQAKGKDLLVGKSSLHNPKKETLSPTTDQPDLKSLSLEFWTDLDPVRPKYPWPHYENIFGEFRLWGETNDLQIATILADIAYRNCKIPTGLSKQKTLEELAFYMNEENQDPEKYYDYEHRFGMSVSAGILAKDKDAFWMCFGCCAKLDVWSEWRDLVGNQQTYKAWNGHDPQSGVQLKDGKVRFSQTNNPAGYFDLAPADYQHLITKLENDLELFLKRMQEWLRKHTDKTTENQILSNFQNYINL